MSVFRTRKPQKWFNQLYDRCLSTFETEIVKYPVKAYKTLRFSCREHGFTLGLTEQADDTYWQYCSTNIDTEMDSLWEFVALIDEEACEGEVIDFSGVDPLTLQWPYSHAHCAEFERFLYQCAMLLAMDSILQSSRPAIQERLQAITHRKVDYDDQDFQLFTGGFPEQAVREALIEKWVEGAALQSLLLDLWGDQLKDTGKELLDRLALCVPNAAKGWVVQPAEVAALTTRYHIGKDLWASDFNEMAIIYLAQALEDYLPNLGGTQYSPGVVKVLKQMTNLLVKCHKELSDSEQAGRWLALSDKL